MALAPEAPPRPDVPTTIVAVPDVNALSYPPRRAYTQSDYRTLYTKAMDGDAASAAELGQLFARGGTFAPNSDEAFRWLTKAMDLGSDPARREFGLLLLRLPGAQRDPARAVPLLRKAAEAGDAEAQSALGMLYAWGEGVERDPAQALVWTRKAADQNERGAVANMGTLLEFGVGTAKNPEDAATWYRRAADLGLSAGEVRLALLYLRGTGVPRDPAQTFSLLLSAAQREDPIAQRLLGLAYRDGWGTTPNQEESIAWLKRAAERSDADALALLADAYLQGRGVPRDALEGWAWLLKAAEAGQTLSQIQVGLAYSNGAPGPGRDHAAAARWLQKALDNAQRESWLQQEERGTPRALLLSAARYVLGTLLLTGDGTDKDPTRALALFEASATQDNVGAQTQLGRLYHFGLGVPHDEEKAVALLKQAAEHGSGTAATLLGDGALLGWNGEKNFAEAVRWYRAGAALHEPTAWLGLARAYEAGRGVPRDNGEAGVWYLLAARAGLVDAQVRMGDIAHFGVLDHKRDDAEALGWYRAAATAGHAGAQYMTGLLTEAKPDQAPEAAGWYRKAGAQGWANANKRMGDAYRDGTLGLTRDDAEALSFYKQAAANGHVAAMVDVAAFTEAGRGTASDQATTHALWRAAADKGAAVAQVRMGIVARDSLLGTTQDDAEAVRWFRTAAEKDDPDGALNLGWMIGHGRGTARDFAQERRWYWRAAALGSTAAHDAIGTVYWFGEPDLPADRAVAAIHFRVAAKAANVHAMFMLGVEAETRPDATAEALSWYRKAADAGWPDATLRLAEAHRDGALGLPRDDAQALKLFEGLSEAGNAVALANVAQFLESGRATVRDPAAALSWWRKAADKGLPGAQLRLGIAYQSADLGLGRDDVEAVRWYRLAAERDDPGAQINLGAMLLEGLGTPQDGAEAVKWLQRAAARGHLVAVINLGSILWDGRAGQTRDRAAAVVHFRVAADAGNPAAQYMLAEAYRLGEGVPADPALVVAWARKAAVQGYGEAQNTLGYAILSGYDGSYDYVEAACWLTLAVERAATDAARQRARANLDSALAQLSEAEKVEAESRAAGWRVEFGNRPYNTSRPNH